MLLNNARKHRLMREALGNDEGRLPSAASSLRTLGVIALCFAVIAFSATGLQEPPRMVAENAHAAPQRESAAHPVSRAVDDASVKAMPADADRAASPAAPVAGSY